MSFKGQQTISLEYEEDLQFLADIQSGLRKVLLIGPELILGKLYDEIGFKDVKSDLLRHLVISRLVFPLSKLKTCEYLLRYQNIEITPDQVYRYMDKLQKSQKQELQQISYEHTLGLFNGGISVVFYDVTTLYFEVSDEDDLRKTGFSKEGKHQHPQIVLGLLVSKYGYPLAFEMFEGNQFEGHTMIPVLESFKSTYQLEKLVVIADAGLMSKKNLQHLSDGGYEFIIGARLKNEADQIKEQLLSLPMKDGESTTIPHPSGHRLIVSYAASRARRDRKNREKGLNKLEKKLSKGRLTKQHINNRGYNKYLKMDGKIDISIDYEKFKADKKWDGLKGYLTNAKLPTPQIIDQYNELWQIEKAFRISKTDLRIRPIYHRLPQRIEAHLIIAFCAYKVYKELERQLKERHSDLTPEKAIELMKTIYSLKIQLPKSNRNRNIIFCDDQKQQQLLQLFNIKTD
ncbi:IS1634 family transposase [Fulvivirga sp. M361]|uniref:IS1634 family transposase n=1 Tax=Fulvivirga sp. M361 TaxID=2594266 RepID=UPI002107973A|nr:IS1634 family transposase [Fulvivirga sp. M361]